MRPKPPEEGVRDQWILIRRACQLLTLHGPSGPRCGSAMNKLEVIADGSLLIHNGVIRQSGPARRVDNLAQARKAREIDAAGKVVMPAFIDADAALVFPRSPHSRRNAIQILSKDRLMINAGDAATDRVRYGCLTMGADDRYAADMRDTVKIFLVHNRLQARPLRIRSVFAPELPANPSLKEKWMRVIRARKLAGIMELTAGPESPTAGELRGIALAAAGHGYSIRLRARDRIAPHFVELALEAGVIAMMSDPGLRCPGAGELSRAGCVHVLAAADAFAAEYDQRGAVSDMLLDGAALALGSGDRGHTEASYNPQYLMLLARERFGLTCEQAIVAMTYNAACCLRVSQITGSLEPGKAADLLFMDVEDYRDLIRRVGHNDVLAVMKAGRYVYQRAGLISD